jgi:hypothetical protein
MTKFGFWARIIPWVINEIKNAVLKRLLENILNEHITYEYEILHFVQDRPEEQDEV